MTRAKVRPAQRRMAQRHREKTVSTSWVHPPCLWAVKWKRRYRHHRLEVAPAATRVRPRPKRWKNARNQRRRSRNQSHRRRQVWYYIESQSKNLEKRLGKKNSFKYKVIEFDGWYQVVVPALVAWNHRAPANHWSRLRWSALIRRTIRHIIRLRDLMWTCWAILRRRSTAVTPQDHPFSSFTILTAAWEHRSDRSFLPVVNRECSFLS